MSAEPATLEERSEAELMACIVGGHTPGPELRALAERLARIPIWERRAIGAAGLIRDHGVPPRRAARFAALWELAERWYPDDRPAIASARDALLLLERLRRAPREEIVLVLLDARHRPVAIDTVAVGTVNASRLAPRDVFAPALRCGAVAVIVGHNHPSGDPSPSRADRLVTTALRSAGDLLGVPVLDHIIVSRHSHHSFRDADGWETAAVA